MKRVVSDVELGIFLTVILALAYSPLIGLLPQVCAQSSGWVIDSTLVSGLPELGIIGENCQCLTFNLTGSGQWALIIGQWNSYTVNEYPFLGYYWNGFQWVSNPALVQGLIAYPNGNDPTIGFNVTGDNTFDMIVGQWAGSNLQYYGKCWTGYAWNGFQWVVNSTIINGLPMNTPLGGGSNYGTLGYNVLGDGKWDLVVDNWGNNGFVGFEWNGIAWTQENSLLNGLPSAWSPSTTNQVPIPCLAYDFAYENTSTLIVGLASGGPPNGAIEGFRWNGVGWTSDSAIVEGVTDLQPSPNTPTMGYNVTGDDKWVLIIGSATADVSQPAYYVGYSWSPAIVPLSVSITPLSALVYVGNSVVFTSTVNGGTPPYNYQWYLNNNPISGATLNTWTFTPTTAGNYTVHLNVTDNLGNIAKSNDASVTVAAQLTASISPMSASVLVGQPVTFTSTVSGGYAQYSYQWYLNENPVSGATSNSWTFTPTTSGVYCVYLKVTDTLGNTTQSETARIMVTSVPVGGYSVSLTQHTTSMPSSVYLALLIMLSAVFTTVRRKTRKEKNN